MPSQCFRQSVVITANGVVGVVGVWAGLRVMESQVMKGFFELLGFGSFMIDVSSWSICFILPLAFLLLFRTWRVRTAARRRGRSSLFRFAFVLLYFPIIWLKLLFLFDTGWGGGWGRGRRGSAPSSSFSKLYHFYLYLLRSGQSFFLNNIYKYTNAPFYRTSGTHHSAVVL